MKRPSPTVRDLLAAMALSVGFFVSAGNESLAGQSTSQFTVNATIANACTVSNTGNISLSETVTSGTTTVSVTCNLGTAWTVGFAGANDTAGQNTLPFHYMKSATNEYIEYVLTGLGVGWTFTDAQRRLANDTSSTPPPTFNATGVGLAGLPIPAVITATATTGTVPFSITTATTGSYTDTVTVTVYF